jgi:predicted O-methyltransferase YrrM
MGIDYTKVQEYLHKGIPKRTPVLAEMERYAAKHNFPIIGPLAGRLLHQLALTIKAKRILELGSGYGYSAIWFAMATGKDGKFVLTDTDEANKKRALACFKKAGIKSKMDFHVADALSVARVQTGKFDVILNDIDKQDYPKTIEPAARLLRQGGLFITDNILWSGRVYTKPQDTPTREIVRFTRLLMSDKRFFTTIIPIRDGIAVAIRL